MREESLNPEAMRREGGWSWSAEIMVARLGMQAASRWLVATSQHEDVERREDESREDRKREGRKTRWLTRGTHFIVELWCEIGDVERPRCQKPNDMVPSVANALQNHPSAVM